MNINIFNATSSVNLDFDMEEYAKGAEEARKRSDKLRELGS